MTHTCIIIISEAFNNPSLSFEDNLWGIIESNHFSCPGFLSDKTLLISPIPIGRVFIFSVFSDIIKDAADFSTLHLLPSPPLLSCYPNVPLALFSTCKLGPSVFAASFHTINSYGLQSALPVGMG